MSEKYVVTWDMLQIHARKLASRLMPSEQWKGIIAVSRGGLVPGALLARELGIRHVDTVCISSYDHDNQRELKVLKRAEGDGEGFIVIDDLVDTGGSATSGVLLLSGEASMFPASVHTCNSIGVVLSLDNVND